MTSGVTPTERLLLRLRDEVRILAAECFDLARDGRDDRLTTLEKKVEALAVT